MGNPKAVVALAAGGLMLTSLSGAASATTAGSTPASAVAGSFPDRALAGSRMPGGTDVKAAAARESQPAPAATVTLVTGDRVRVDTGAGGQQSVSAVAPAGNGAGSPGFVQTTWGGDRYVFPYAAVPYLGSLLDPRLFDVSYLVRAGLDDAHSKTLPVQIQATSAGAIRDVPGVTHATAGTAMATVAKRDAGAFGRELARRWHEGHARGKTTRTLPGITRIGLAQPKAAPALPGTPGQWPAAAATRPDKQHGKPPAYHTLTLDFVGSDGEPATAIGFVQNVDDASLGTTFIPGRILPLVGGQGTASPDRLSLPEGDYSIEVAVLTPHPGTIFGLDAALVVKPQVTVRSDRSITLDARTAVPFTSSVAGVTPTERTDELNLFRGSTTGGGAAEITSACSRQSFATCVSGIGLLAVAGPIFRGGNPFPEATLSATPTHAVSDGTLDFVAESQLFAGGTPTDPEVFPGYYLEFPERGRIPASLTYTLTDENLTAVREHVHYDPAHTVYGGSGCVSFNPRLVPAVAYPWGWYKTLAPYDIGSKAQPGVDTVYWYTSERWLTRWQDSFNRCNNIVLGPVRRIRPGQVIDSTWGEHPYVPHPVGYYDVSAGVPVAVCPACRQDGNLTPTIFGMYGPTRRWSFYRDGDLVIDTHPNALHEGSVAPGNTDLPLVQRPATYRLDWTMGHALGGIDPGLTTETSWTFHSSAADPVADLPGGEQCAPDPSRRCQYLPLLFLDYRLALDEHNNAPAGRPFRIALSVEHQPGEAPPTGVTATVAVSFDDGKTWSGARRAKGHGDGRFEVTITHPPLSETTGYVSLRVTAEDDAGNSVTQTAIQAYQLTSQ